MKETIFSVTTMITGVFGCEHDNGCMCIRSRMRRWWFQECGVRMPCM